VKEVAVKCKNRLQRLERALGIYAGCPACQALQDNTVLVSVEFLPDGTKVYPDGAPEPCPACGEIPGQVIEIEEIIVPSPADADDRGQAK